MKISLLSLTLVLTLLSARPASAIEPLSALDLQQICADAKEAPQSERTKLCTLYVQGFLDGAVATDGRVAEAVMMEADNEESFTDRAIRTRVIDRIRAYGPTVYAKFCVGQPDPIADVVAHVLEELELLENLDGVAAQTIVYSALRRHYPCDS